MAKHIEKRGGRWYAVLDIPKEVRHLFEPTRSRKKGNAPKPLRRFVQTLETDSESKAARAAAPIIAGWKAEIAKVRGEANDPAALFRRAMEKAQPGPERERIRHIAADIAEDTGDVHFYHAATGQLVPFTTHLDDWLAASEATDKTKDMQRHDVERFAEKFKYVQDVTRKEVSAWATGLISDGLSRKTVVRILSALRGYWRYLQSQEAAPEDVEPFQVKLPRQGKKNGNGKRKPFEPADVVKLLKAASDDQQLADLIRLGMWTGCRIEELCALPTAKVQADYFSVEDAKTPAGWRDVPIHRELKQTMTRLLDESTDGFVLSGLTENKYGDRSNAIGKRFGRLKTALGFGPEYVFHSIRKTVVTILENAGVPENVVADIVGHEKPRITYGLYSGGATLEVKAAALAKLKYPKTAAFLLSN